MANFVSTTRIDCLSSIPIRSQDTFIYALRQTRDPLPPPATRNSWSRRRKPTNANEKLVLCPRGRDRRESGFATERRLVSTRRLFFRARIRLALYVSLPSRSRVIVIAGEGEDIERNSRRRGLLGTLIYRPFVSAKRLSIGRLGVRNLPTGSRESVKSARSHTGETARWDAGYFITVLLSLSFVETSGMSNVEPQNICRR